MSGVSNITEKILGDARAWSEEQLNQAKAEAAELGKQYAATAASQAEEILAGARDKAAAIQERAKSQAEMDRRKQMLVAKQEAVGKAFNQALENLTSMSEEERALLMVRLTLKYQTEDAELIFNKADQQAVGPAVVDTINSIYARQQIKEIFSGKFLEKVKKLEFDLPEKRTVKLSKKVGGFQGGFIIKQGDVEQNCTFEVLVNAVRDELEGEVSSILFQ